MRVTTEKFSFSRTISRALVLGVVVMFFMSSFTAWASSQKDEIVSCGEFVALMAKHQPDSSLFPENPSQYAKEELYRQTVQKLSAKGFRVLDKKSYHDPLEANEFVQVSYAFANGPLGKNLFEQKLFLKKAGIIDSADVGLTTAYDGLVYQTHRNQNSTTPVKLATPVYMHDRIKTNLLSKATFTFDDKSTLTLGEDSTVNITKHIYDPEKDLRQTIVHLSRGTVRFVVTKGKAAGSMFKVVTPTAIAGVRGTEFVVDVAPDGKTTFLVLEGQIETKPLPLKGKGVIALISAGESQAVSKNGVAAEVRNVPPGLLKKLTGKTTPPGLTMVNNGFSKQMARGKVLKLAFANKPAKGKSMKAKVLKMASNNALFHADVLGKRFERIKLQNSPNATPGNSVKANAKTNAKANAKANAQAAAKANARQTAQESTVTKGLERSMKCLKTGMC